MSRPLRVGYPDAFYHILSRGNERRPIFRDRRDCVHFLELLGRCWERFGLEIWSYVLMGNHYPLIASAHDGDLTKPIRGRERPLRDVLIYAIWRRGRYSLAEIGQEFGEFPGHNTYFLLFFCCKLPFGAVR